MVKMVLLKPAETNSSMDGHINIYAALLIASMSKLFSIVIIIDRSINVTWTKKDVPLHQVSSAGSRAPLSQVLGHNQFPAVQYTRRTCKLNIPWSRRVCAR